MYHLYALPIFTCDQYVDHVVMDAFCVHHVVMDASNSKKQRFERVESRKKR